MFTKWTAFQDHYVAAKPFGALMNSSTLGNYDAMPPLQCRAKRENECTPATILVEVQSPSRKFRLSREFVRGKSRGHEPRPNPYATLFPFFSM